MVSLIGETDRLSTNRKTTGEIQTHVLFSLGCSLLVSANKVV